MELFGYFIKNFELYFDNADIKINYGKQHDGQVSIVKNVDDSFWKNKTDINENKIVWKKWKNVSIPFLFNDSDKEEILTNKDDRIIINYDIVASTFYFLSGWNEYVCSDKDDFGRVKYNSTLIHRLKIDGVPVVNYYFDILNDALSQIKGKTTKIDWNQHTFAVALSHDIDVCNDAWLQGSFSEFKKKRFLSIPKLITNRWFGKDDWFNFSKIVGLERKYDANSTFYFLPRKGKVNEWKNADYDIMSTDIKKVIRDLKENGNEIGVHGSFGSHKSSELLKQDIARITNSTVEGNRFHFLMFDLACTVSILENAGIKYDTTIGFAEQIGFRRSICLPFYLFNFEKNEISTVLEIPLVVMDASLIFKKYMGLSQKESVTAVIAIIEEVKKFNGVFSILWHNTSFSDYKYTGWREVYEQILSYCKDNNALLTSNIDIYNKITTNSTSPKNK
ncbi:MAG: hypothetical protein GZ091_15240 [Paludibacter sp.]|nr:hypothetical protein [Paludibacter sp.]